MKKISRWARVNPWSARISIVVIHLLVILLALLMGKFLFALGINISGFLLSAAIILFIFGALRYPDKKEKNNYPSTFNFYARQKLCDWMLSFSTFLLVGFISNANKPVIFVGTLNGASPAYDLLTPVPKITHVKNKKASFKLKYTRAERKAVLKELKSLLKESLRKDTGTNNNLAIRVVLMVLTITGGVILTMLLAALACNLSCSGSDALAIFVLAFGITGLVFLMIAAIKGILKRYPVTKEIQNEALSGKTL